MLSPVSLLCGTLGLSLSVLLVLCRPRRTADDDHDHDSGPVLIVASTVHARYRPTTHAFRYPVLYVGLDLERETTSGILTTQADRWRPLTLRAADYLGDGPGDLRTKLMRVLRQHGQQTESIGRVHLITTPRLFGYAFNPVSFYFCYGRGDTVGKDEERLLTVVLEVNNTFGEKHVYVLGPDEVSPEDRPGYTASWTFDRRFHVSPFNDRLGQYRLRCRDPAVLPRRLDMHLTLLEPDGSRKLTAQVGSSTTRFVPTRDIVGSLLLLVRHGAAVFLTVPRILRQAYTLHYAKRLAVYLRPEPLSDLPGALRRQVIAPSDAYFRAIVLRYLAQTGRDIKIVSVPTEETILITHDGNTTTLPSRNAEDDDIEDAEGTVVFTVWANSFWTSLATSQSPVHCLLTDSLSLLPAASPIFTVEDRHAFLDLFDPPIQKRVGGSKETFLERQRRTHRGPPRGFILPKDLAAYSHLTNRPLDESINGQRIVYTATVLSSLWMTTAGNALFEHIATFAGAAGRPGDAWLRVANTVGKQ